MSVNNNARPCSPNCWCKIESNDAEKIDIQNGI